jgi:putative transcriptional regulator
MSTGESLAGRLLVASPILGDPNFARSVVLVLDHDDDGALGVVINRPTPLAVGDVLPRWGELTSGPPVVFQGGPVSLDSALALAAVPGEEEPLGWQRVVGALGLVDLEAPPELLAPEMAALRVFAGYAGWGGGQLEEEIGQGAWYVVEAEPADVFSDRPQVLWRAVLRRQRGDVAFLSTYPEDPSRN